MSHMYAHAVIGGTMDAFHAGHQAYIADALVTAQTVTIYLNDEQFVAANKSYVVKPVATRLELVRTFLHDYGYEARVDLKITHSLDDIRRLYLNPAVDVVIVAPDRALFAEQVNDARLKPFAIKVLPRHLDRDGNDISSSKINGGLR